MMMSLTDRQHHILEMLLLSERQRWIQAQLRSIKEHGRGHWYELEALEREQEIVELLDWLRRGVRI